MPVLGNLSDVANKKWNSAFSVIDADATVTHASRTNLDGGVLTVKLKATASSTVTANDLLTILSEGTGTGQINISGTDVRLGTTSIGTWNGAAVPGGSVLTVTLKSTATVTVAQALIRRIACRNSSATQVLGGKIIQIEVSDGAGGTSLPAYKIIHLTL